MTNQQLTDELKVLMDQYANGELQGDNLRILRNMLYIMGDNVKFDIEAQNRIKKKGFFHEAV